MNKAIGEIMFALIFFGMGKFLIWIGDTYLGLEKDDKRMKWLRSLIEISILYIAVMGTVSV